MTAIDTSAPSSEWGCTSRIDLVSGPSIDQKKRSVAAVSQSCRLRTQAPVDERGGQVGDRLPLDEHIVPNQPRPNEVRDWLGGRDSNPDNVVQRGRKRRR
jgi:hypothetical protein